jgi:threonine synthase
MSELRCGTCSAVPESPIAWRCEACYSPLELELPGPDRGTLIDPARAGVWRYRGWLPQVPPLSLGEPTTGVAEIEVAGRSMVAKVEGGLPTGSFKDRGSAVLIAWLRARGAREIVEDSSGNAGASMAAYAARAGLRARIFVPADASPAKLVQVRAHAATLVSVPGPRQAAADAAAAAVERADGAGTVYAAHLWQPAFLAGTATFAYELWETLGRRAPDVLVAPLGGGTLLLGVHLGFERLREGGLIDTIPRLVGVQSTASAPLARAFDNGDADAEPVQPGPTIAEGIRIARPPRARQILAAIRKTGGAILAVGDDEVRRSLTDLLRQGLFVEPTSAAAHAGARRLVTDGLVGPRDAVAIALTGHGLKAAAALAELTGSADRRR